MNAIIDDKKINMNAMSSLSIKLKQKFPQLSKKCHNALTSPISYQSRSMHLSWIFFPTASGLLMLLQTKMVLQLSWDFFLQH
jgi:hypothetical protein